MAPQIKNCRSSTANTPGVGKPWRPGEVRQVTDDQAALLTQISGFRVASEGEVKVWQTVLDQEAKAAKPKAKSKAKAKPKTTKRKEKK